MEAEPAPAATKAKTPKVPSVKKPRRCAGCLGCVRVCSSVGGWCGWGPTLWTAAAGGAALEVLGCPRLITCEVPACSGGSTAPCVPGGQVPCRANNGPRPAVSWALPRRKCQPHPVHPCADAAPPRRRPAAPRRGRQPRAHPPAASSRRPTRRRQRRPSPRPPSRRPQARRLPARRRRRIPSPLRPSPRRPGRPLPGGRARARWVPGGW